MPSPGSPAMGVWNAILNPAMDGTKTAHVENIVISRDRVKITLKEGTIQFAQPVNSIAYGASFHGNGTIQVDPPNPIEAHQLSLFTKQDKLNMVFSDATFISTDGLFDEVASQAKWQPAPASSDDLYAKRLREGEGVGGGRLPRLFKSLMSADRKSTAYFLAELKTQDKGWIEVAQDALQLEDIIISRWSGWTNGRGRDTWMNFPSGGRDSRTAYADPAARLDFLVPAYQISSTLADNADLSSTAKLTINPRKSGERVLLFSQDENLRVSSVKDAEGHALEFVQSREAKDRTQSYGDYIAVILPAATQAGQNFSLEFQSSGKRIVRKVGDGNYFCESFGWYPAIYAGSLGIDAFAFRSDFDMIFRNSKRYQLVATGNKISETTDGKDVITVWKSEIPLAAAGFAFGDYKTYDEKVGDVNVRVYANKQPDDLLKSIQMAADNPLGELEQGARGGPQSSGAAIGNLSAAALVKVIGTETGNTLRVFENYFGPYPYKTLAVTNIIGGYGQGWPGLLYLSWITFLDSTQRHELGIQNQTKVSDFFRAHESSHQWWGHRVGWKSYHDQWLSEGFAEYSGLLYVQFRQNQKEFLTQLKIDRDLLKAPDRFGHRIDQIGPMTLGQRIFSSETDGSSYQNLVYSKGGYVLHMLRYQMLDSRNPDPDHLFKDMMHDYCKTFDNKSASTEDFKAIVEKHMTRGMDLDGNHKMDWFFNQYVYGTGMPQYSFSAKAEPAADGKTKITGTLSRTGVPDNWKDVVAVYLHVGEKTLRAGTLAAMHPSEPVEFVVAGKVDRISINDNEDLLADVKQ
ncbi:MAG TPA: M1 family aminopeptidase [Candidatus Dormibacteraeota bacterium]|nr:M1 family aminopeptidase [Candidatus Dormibacteraeota bacterium]